MSEQRRLAAIVAADVVGYSRLMGRDESGTLAALRAVRRDIVDPRIAAHRGRIVKTTGDGLLLEFASVVDAVRCVIGVQEAMRAHGADLPEDRRIGFRIGVNLGDIIIEGDDIFGDGVNVAARLQEIAPPGGVCVSSRVHDDVRDRLDVKFEDDGERTLKNIARPLRVWRWESGAIGQVRPSITNAPLALPDKPSIAVLPFTNMSGDPEQEYFADGMVEEIITALSRNKELFVIARNSTFAYKGKSPDTRQVGRELGVLYVLEGSVRKAGRQVRITAQLIDATSGAHLWADRFEGDLEDIFTLQDQVTSRVIGGIAPSLESAERERVRRKVGNLQAYDCYLRSLSELYRFSQEANEQALVYARRAVALDPRLSQGYVAVLYTLTQRWSFGWIADERAEMQEAERTIRGALDVDGQDARVLAFCGQAMIVILRRGEEGASLLDEAAAIDPNSAFGLRYHANAQIMRNEPEKAIGDLERALRLSPIDIGKWYGLTLMARAYNLCGRPEDAVQAAAAALRHRPNFANAQMELVVANVLAGRLDASREALVTLRRMRPEDRVSTYRPPHLPPSGVLKYQEALRLAGLPE